MMIGIFNSFLNFFEKIFTRCVVACLVTIAYPFIVIAFIFGIVSLEKIKTKDDED